MVANSLSRTVCSEDNNKSLNLVSVEMPSLNAADLRIKQLAGEELERVINAQEQAGRMDEQ